MYVLKYVCNKPDNSHVAVCSSSTVIHMICTNLGFMSKVKITLPSFWRWTNCFSCYSWCRAPGRDIWQIQRSARWCCWWRNPLPHSLGSETYCLWLPLPSTQCACHHRQQRYIIYLMTCCNAILTLVRSLRIQLASWKCFFSFVGINKISRHG